MRPTRRTRACTALLFATVLAACGGGGGDGGAPAPTPTPAPPSPAPAPGASLSRGATSSGPIQLSPNDKTVWVVSPDTNSVAAVNVEGDSRQLLGDMIVGKEPRNLAIAPDGRRVFVANSGENTVTVLDATAAPYAALATITVGSQPYGLAFSPNGRKLYVANSSSNSVSVIDPVSYRVLKTIDGVGQDPRGVAVTNDGDDQDDDEKVYVTQFFGVDRDGVKNGTIPIGADDYKEGRVAVISTANDTLVKQAVLEPMADTGFKSNGSALKRIAAKNPPVFDVVTGAFPNMLQSVVVKGNRAYLPNTCASTDGPVRFNVNMQSCLSVLDIATDAEGKVNGASQTLNMNRGINFESEDPADPVKKLFLAVPWAVAFKHGANEGYAVSLSSNVIVKVKLDADGTPTIDAPKQAGDAGAIVRILVGQGPRGIVINGNDTRAYVANENSRDVSVIDLTTDKELHRFASASMPQAGSEDARRLFGKAVFDSSTGVDEARLAQLGFGEVQSAPPRLSKEGWGSCFACHGFARTDNAVWIFASGPRRSSPLHWSFNPAQVLELLAGTRSLDDADAKILNHTALNDNFQDFQNNILDVSGGAEVTVDVGGVLQGRAGLLFDADGNTLGGPAGAGAGGSKPPLVVDNRNRAAALDALAFYAATGITQPISPYSFEPLKSQAAAQVARGRQLFADANCASCHGGAGWASGRLNLLATKTVVKDQGVDVLQEVLRNVGTFDAAAINEVKANGTTAAGALGYNPPSLLGAFNLGPYLHNGSAFTLEDVMALKPHRIAGLAAGTADPFDNPAHVADIVAFLKSVDATTAPFDIGAARVR